MWVVSLGLLLFFDLFFKFIRALLFPWVLFMSYYFFSTLCYGGNDILRFFELNGRYYSHLLRWSSDMSRWFPWFCIYCYFTFFFLFCSFWLDTDLGWIRFIYLFWKKIMFWFLFCLSSSKIRRILFWKAACFFFQSSI